MLCHPICIYLKCVLYFCNINSLYPGVFLGVCVCLVTEADSANVTQVSGTHSSDYCAIPPSFRLSLISLPSCIPPSFPSSLLLFCSLLSSLHLSFPFLFYCSSFSFPPSFFLLIPLYFLSSIQLSALPSPHVSSFLPCLSSLPLFFLSLSLPPPLSSPPLLRLRWPIRRRWIIQTVLHCRLSPSPPLCLFSSFPCNCIIPPSSLSFRLNIF